MEQQVLDLIRKGYTYPLICRELSITREELIGIIRRHDLPSPKRKNITPASVGNLLSVVERNLSLQEACDELGILPRFLRRDFIRQGVSIPEAYLDEQTTRDLEMIELYKQNPNLTLSDVAKKYGLSKQALHQRVTIKYGLSLQSLRPTPTPPSKQEIKEHLILHNIQQTAIHFQVSTYTLHKWIKDYEISIPKHIDALSAEILSLYQQGLGIYKISKRLSNPIHPNSVYKRLKRLGVTCRPSRRLNHAQIILDIQQGLSITEVSIKHLCSKQAVIRIRKLGSPT